jgi:hypothetical protein
MVLVGVIARQMSKTYPRVHTPKGDANRRDGIFDPLHSYSGRISWFFRRCTLLSSLWLFSDRWHPPPGGRCHLFEAAACAAGYRARPHGLGCPRSFDSLAPCSARPFGSRYCGIYPGLSQGPVLPSPSPKSLRQFNQTNHGNGIISCKAEPPCGLPPAIFCVTSHSLGSVLPSTRRCNKSLPKGDGILDAGLGANTCLPRLVSLDGELGGQAKLYNLYCERRPTTLSAKIACLL